MDGRQGRRRFVLGALAMALALLVLGNGAFQAAAQTRKDARTEANDFIAWCVSVGGDPQVFEASEDSFHLQCDMPDGSIFDCQWGPTTNWNQDCQLGATPRPGNDLPVFEVDPDSPLASPDDLGHDLTPAVDAPKDRDHGEKRHGKGNGKHKGGKGGRR